MISFYLRFFLIVKKKFCWSAFNIAMARRSCTWEAAKFWEDLSDSDNEHGKEIDDVQSEYSEDDGANFSDEIQETEDENSATEEEHDETCASVAEKVIALLPAAILQEWIPKYLQEKMVDYGLALFHHHPAHVLVI